MLERHIVILVGIELILNILMLQLLHKNIHSITVVILNLVHTQNMEGHWECCQDYPGSDNRNILGMIPGIYWSDGRTILGVMKGLNWE